jgi:hypothetical protein
MNPEGIPAELRERRQWVVWRGERRDGKRTKVPYRVDTGQRASVDDPGSWASYEQASAFARRFNFGIGFVFTTADPFVASTWTPASMTASSIPTLLRSSDSLTPTASGRCRAQAHTPSAALR